MTPKEAKQLPIYTPNPLLAELPDYLKDPANFKKIQRALLDTLATSHSHSEVIDFTKCFHCQVKVQDLAEMKNKLGFRSAAQYLEWKKTHELIITKRRVPLR